MFVKINIANIFCWTALLFLLTKTETKQKLLVFENSFH